MLTRIIEWPWPLTTTWSPSTLLKLSYPEPTRANFFPQHQHYGIGWNDVTFVTGWTVLFAILREVLMRGVFVPFIRNWLLRREQKRVQQKSRPARKEHANGIKHESPDCGNGYALGNRVTHSSSVSVTGNGDDVRIRPGANGKTPPSGPPMPASKRTARLGRSQEKKITRFAEQGWSLTYYLVYWSFGCYIHYNSPWYPFKLDELWIGFPETHIPIPAPLKFYYLSQLAFWLTQVITINMEDRRKDYHQMMTHHIITLTLMLMSYTTGFLRVGCMILVLLDFCDILLPLAKMLKYMSLDPLADAMFAIFLVSWLVTRQGLYTLVVLSVIRDAPRLAPFGDGEGPRLTTGAWRVYSVLLSSLAVLLLIWLVMIIRVASNVVRGKGADDSRSDDEDSDSDDRS